MNASATDSDERASSAPRLRILFFIQSLDCGGAERQLAYLANGLSLRHWDVHLAVRRLGPNWNRVDRDRIQLHTLESRGNLDPSLTVGIWRLLREVQPDVVLTWLPQMDILAGLLSTLAGVPWVLCERTSYRTQSWTIRAVARRWIARGASAVVANSPEGAAHWDPLRRKDRIVAVVPNIVPLAAIDAVASRIQPRDRFAPAQLEVVAVGRLVPTRHFDVLIAAWKTVWPRTNASLTILGDGPERAQLQRLIDELGLADAVRLEGFVDETIPKLCVAAAYVSMSSVEGLPNATVEAAAARCPMVLSDIPAHRNLFSDDEAVFVPLSDPISLAESIVSAVTDPVGSCDRAAAARMRVSKAAENDIPEIYDRILRRLLVTAHR